MACEKCGSGWVTATGKDCKTCPHCSKRQRHEARKQGRWVEPKQKKTCEECGAEFTAIGLRDITQRVLCENPSCKAARNKRNRKASAKRRSAGVYTLSRDQKPKRHCQFSGCGKELTRRDQKLYCGKPCFYAAVDAGEQQFKGRVHDHWAMLVDWAYEWQAHPFGSGDHPRGHDSKLYKPRPSCEVCGKEVKKQESRFCSYECNKAWRGDRPCKCGTLVPNSSAYSRPSCDACKRESRRQQKRMYGCYRRRCKTYGGHFNSSVKPRDVFARDGWKCHLCGRLTSKLFRLTDPRSATVDHHPIPLSKGGDHDWHNVRCACFECNTKKGNKWDGQMRLALT